jgi:transcription elongation factor Elf1
MPQLADDGSEIRTTDIVFDCPHCGKSLAIDYHGAGLTVDCSDCGKEVAVPIPEGMDVADVDSTEEEQEIRIVNLRRLLASAEARIAELEQEVDTMKSRHRALQQDQRGIRQDFRKILRAANTAEGAIHEIIRLGESGVSET